LPRSTALLFCALLLASCLTRAVCQDQHLLHDPAGHLYSSSSFAHGYVHGYEQGFHFGDLDLQLSHAPQEVKKNSAYKSADKQFKKEYGDKRTFVEGYQSGFRTGYADAFDGSEFRAVQNLRELAHELPQVDPHATPILDLAISDGYLDGVRSGLNDGRISADYRPDGSDCELALRFKEPPAKFFCSVYSLGYRLGYSDGFHNQHPKPVERHIAGEQ
jgi:hypothetical protein